VKPKKVRLYAKGYNIPVNETFRKDVGIMCNLGQGIEESAEKKVNTNVITNMYNNNFTVEQIAVATGKTVEEVKEIIEKLQLVLA
jgi:hypothetical protein